MIDKARLENVLIVSVWHDAVICIAYSHLLRVIRSSADVVVVTFGPAKDQNCMMGPSIELCSQFFLL